MAYNFVSGDRDQLMLMPPSVADWLPGDHLAFFVLEAVDGFDLSAFRSRYRADGWGAAAYDPKVMVALLFYAYCVGERSSRRIERACIEQVPYRVVTANLTPDHATIARFRATHAEALGALFSQVLSLCVRVGAVDASVVAVDGTKMGANASSERNLSREALEAYAAKVLAEAAAVDEAEDALYGDKRGDELAEEWAKPGPERQRRIKEMLEELAREQDAAEAEAAAKVAAYEAAKAEGKPRKGQPPTGKARPTRRSANVTDPDSRLLKGPHGFVQGYNAQAAVSADQFIVAAEVTNSASDATQLLPMVEAAKAELAAVGAPEPDAVVADAGYWSNDNASTDVGPEMLIVPPPQTLPPPGNDDRHRARLEVIERVEAGSLRAADAAELLGVNESYVNHLRRTLRRHGPGALGVGPPIPTTDGQRLAQAMVEKLATPSGRAKMDLRGVTVEPVFGQLKWNRGITHFARRGINAVRSEWRLIAATHNLLKLKTVLTPPHPAVA